MIQREREFLERSGMHRSVDINCALSDKNNHVSENNTNVDNDSRPRERCDKYGRNTRMGGRIETKKNFSTKELAPREMLEKLQIGPKVNKSILIRFRLPHK